MSHRPPTNRPAVPGTTEDPAARGPSILVAGAALVAVVALLAGAGGAAGDAPGGGGWQEAGSVAGGQEAGSVAGTPEAASAAGSQEAPPLAGEKDSRERRPLELEDYYRLQRVGSLGIAPGGDWVAYTLSTPVEATNDDHVETWVARTDASAPPERIRHRGEDVSDPGWLDDGRLRYRHGDETWAVDPAHPSDPERFEEPDGIVSPDGRWVARVEPVAVEPRPAPEMTDFQRRHEERFEGHAFDWYPFKRDGEDFPLGDPREREPEEIFVEPADGGGGARKLTDLGLDASNLEWSPDGRSLLFSVNEGILDELAYGTRDLFLVTVDGETTRLTEDGYNYTGASFSPEGDRIAYVRSYGTDLIIERELDHGGPRDLYVHPLDGGEPRNLTADWDLDAGSPRWSPDGRYLYFTTNVRGGIHLFRVAADGGPVEQVTDGDRRLLGLEIDDAFRRMTYMVGDFDRPPEVWVADVDGPNEERLTGIHRDFLADVEVATHPSETVRWESYDGTPVEGFLLFPHGYDPDGGPYPLIVVNHGGPHSAYGYSFNFKWRFFNANGYVLFLPNFRASVGYGTDFKWATWGGWGNRDGEDVVSGVDFLIEHYPVDPERVGSTGHSYGGILTNWLITRYPERFRAAVSGAGESNWTSNYALSDVARTKDTEFFGPPWEPRSRQIMIEQSPYLHCGEARTPTLFVHGEVDYRVPLTGSIQLYTCLKRLGVSSKLIIYEGVAHGIREHWDRVHRKVHELRWWERYLKPESLPAAETDR